MPSRLHFVCRRSNNPVCARYDARGLLPILVDDMSHVLQAISDAFLSSASRPFAAFDHLVRKYTRRLLSRD
jgi:hypothetical protein